MGQGLKRRCGIIVGIFVGVMAWLIDGFSEER